MQKIIGNICKMMHMTSSTIPHVDECILPCM